MADAAAVRTRTTCRSCDSRGLLPVLSLGSQYVSNFVDGPGPSDEVKVPLELVLCDVSQGGCGLLQLRHTVSPDLLYRYYWYRSVVNNTMRDALANVCCSVEKTIPLRSGDLVLDIGCNDGTMLRSYRTKGLKLVGFEPATNLIAEAQAGTTRIINDFFSFQAFQSAFGGAKAKVVTSIAMFYDLEEPNSFVSDVARCLDVDGIWVVQMSYLPSMLMHNAFDNICHEHLEYYSLMSVRNLLDGHGLEVFDVELNDVNGGSFRLYIRHRKPETPPPASATERIKEMEQKENALGLQNRTIYDEFAVRLKALKTRLVEFITQETAKGKTVYAYGASTKGNTLLQYFGLDSTLIRGAAERNPDKWGKKTVGTMIPIISEEQARADNPDYFLILPWHFLEGFKTREEQFLNQGGKFIVPLPEFQVIGSGDA